MGQLLCQVTSSVLAPRTATCRAEPDLWVPLTMAPALGWEGVICLAFLSSWGNLM